VETPRVCARVPGFVAEVRRIFALKELQEQFVRMEGERELDDANRPEARGEDEPDDDFADPPALVAADQKRFGIVKAMLLETHLGTS
jgi:hypothetical protein